MKTRLNLLATGVFLAAVWTGFGQPVITTQPQSCTNAVGTIATFTVGATNCAPLAYQWQKYLTDWSALTNCTDASLVLTNVQTSDEADYRVAVTNVDGATNSAPAHLYVIVPPKITRITNYNASVSLGASVKMQVWATGTVPSCQWWFGGLVLPGKTSSTLNLTNVQDTNAGLYTVVVTNWAGSASTNASLDVDPTFTKITTGAIASDKQHWHGHAWGDYNNDGYLDLIILGTSNPNLVPIYRNNGDGTFTRTNTPSLQGLGSPVKWYYNWVDYDNDGHLDLFSADYSAYPGGGGAGKNLLAHSNGDGTFTRITQGPIATDGAISDMGAWGDYDRDGDLDLFVANGAWGFAYATNWFYQNQGDGSFLKLTNGLVRPLITEVAVFGSPTWVDVDEDGWPDLFLTAYPSTSRLYRNTGVGGFVQVIGDPLVSEAPAGIGNGMWLGQAWADYDNDGHLDVIITASGDPGYIGPLALFRNDGAGHFTKVTTNAIDRLAGERGNMASADWGDYDNDGWIDLFVANGYSVNDASRCLLYRNNGDSTFTKITAGSLANDRGGVLGAHWVDINNDGFLDLFCTEHDDNASTPNRLYHNNGNSNSWLCVKCVGTASPRWGTGTKVRVKATIRGTPMWQLRLIDAGGTPWGGQSFVAHFGLGDATNVDVLRIEWTSGIVQELHNVPARQYLTVTEPTRLQMSQPGQLQIQCWKGMSYSIESSPDLHDWNSLATVTNLTGKLQWTDPDAPGPSPRFYRAVKP